MHKLRIALLTTLAFATLAANMAFAQPGQSRQEAFPLAASDSIGYRLATIRDYTDYKLKLVSWGGAPDFHPANIAKFKSHLREAEAVGTRISAKIGTRTEYKGFIDADPSHVEEAKCINLQGVPYMVPDANQNELYKGHKPYWFCTNNDAFKRYVQSKLAGSVDPRVFGVTIDDPEGSSVLTLNREGCYCSSCVTKFGKYLSRTQTPQQLAALGVGNPATFDIRQFHQRHAATPISKRPLYKEYEAFQLEQMAAYINDIMANYKTQSKLNIVRGANISPYSWLAYHLKDSLDYFTSEVSEGAGEGTITSPLPVLAFKLAGAYGKLAAVMATGDDNSYLMREGRSTMLSAWIAEAYAYGHYFMAPIEYFYYSKREGRSGFFKPRDQSRQQALYAFIKKNAPAFDNLKSAARTCIAIAPETVRHDRKQLEELVRALSATNIPFDIAIPEIALAGSKSGVSPAAAYTHVMFMDRGKYSEADRARFLDRMAPKAAIIRSLGEVGALRISHNSPNQLVIVPRASSGKLVLHVLNKAYSNSSDSLAPASNVTLTIPKTYLSGKKPGGATYVLAPGGTGAAPPPPANLPVSDARDTVTITLPSVPFWCIVEMKLS